MTLWHDPSVRNSLALCEKHGAFLFQARPDLFPEGYVTPVEELLWGRHYEQRATAMKGK
jgi:hypothetical protein